MSNPILGSAAFNERALRNSATISVGGVVAKTLLMLAVLVAAGVFTLINTPAASLAGLAGASCLLGFVLAMITIAYPDAAFLTSLPYAAAEGVALGAISGIAEAKYPGIGLTAAVTTAGGFGVMLLLWQSGIIKVTEKTWSVIIGLLSSVLVFYIVDIALTLNGVAPFFRPGNPMAFGVSFLITLLAAISFVLDFDHIESLIASRAPKHLEWYSGFGLIVGIVWFYVEVLRLLSLLRGSSK